MRTSHPKPSSEVADSNSIGPQIDGERLRIRLYECHLTQEDLAHMCGIAQKTVSNVITGKHTAGLDTRYRLALVIARLGLDDGTVVSGDDGLIDYANALAQ